MPDPAEQQDGLSRFFTEMQPPLLPPRRTVENLELEAALAQLAEAMQGIYGER